MLVKTNVVYQNDGAGAGGETNPPASPSAGQTVAVDAETLSKLVKSAIAEELKPVKGEISGLYSRQDKDRNAFREFMDEVKKQEAAGLSPDQAFTAAQNEINSRAEVVAEKQMLKDIHGKLFGSSSPQAAGNGESGADVQATAELQKYGISTNEADAIELLRSLAPLSAEAKEAKVSKFILGKLAPQQPTSPAGLTQGAATGGAQAKPDATALQEEQSRLMKNPSRNHKRLTEIRTELAKAGT